MDEEPKKKRGGVRVSGGSLSFKAVEMAYTNKALLMVIMETQITILAELKNLPREQVLEERQARADELIKQLHQDYLVFISENIVD